MPGGLLVAESERRFPPAADAAWPVGQPGLVMAGQLNRDPPILIADQLFQGVSQRLVQ
jgi:hypothetical protein